MSGDIEARFLAAVQNSYEMYKEHGARSNKKLKELHGWVIEELKRLLDDSYVVSGISDSSTNEKQVEGFYYPKRVDISIEKDNKVIGVVSIKFITSNFRQNANNYLEQQMGETANLRRNNIVFGHLLCVRVPIPYYNKEKEITRHEQINDQDIEKYAKLAADHSNPHAPDVQAVAAFFWDETTDSITKKCDREDLPNISDKNYEALQTTLNVEGFFELLKRKIEDKAMERGRTGT